MSQLKAIGVRLFIPVSPPDEDFGTNDNMFLGIVGTGGGREFPLKTKDGGDFAASASGEGTRIFVLGNRDIVDLDFESALLDGKARFPNRTEEGGDDDPGRLPIDLELVNFVYLRKQGLPEKPSDVFDDDGCVIRLFTVTLYGAGEMRTGKREFELFSPNDLKRMSNEDGHIVYLREVGPRS